MNLKKIIKNSLIVSLLFTNLNIDGLALNKNISIKSNNLSKSTSINPEDLAVGEWITDIPVNSATNGYIQNVDYVNGKLYFMICLGDEDDYFNNRKHKLNIYDIESGLWEEVESTMPSNGTRREFLSTVVEDTIYYIGGVDDDTIGVSTVDAYNTTRGTWESKKTSPNLTVSAGLVPVGDKIYLIGGRSQVWNQPMTVTIYDTTSDTWEVKETIGGTRRIGSLPLLVGNYIYNIGGHNDVISDDFNSVEAYNVKTNTWETKSSLYDGDLSYMSGFALNNKIYVYDGYVPGGSNLENPNYVKVYDINSNSWVDEENRPNTNSYGFNTVVIDGLVCNFTTNNTVDIYKASDMTEEEMLAEEAVALAESTRDINQIKIARNLINQLPDGDFKRSLIARLNDVIPDLELDKETSTNLVDLYIQPQSTLTVTMSTNSIVFDDFSGVADSIKENALELTINSSLPYEINSYLVSEIQNTNKTETLDKSILKIKANSDSNYKTFTDLTTPIKLIDNQTGGVETSHGIDLKLDSSVSFKTDVYKTTLKFEIKQK